MSAPHDLPALLWSGLALEWLAEEDGVNKIEERISRSGWDPQWRFGMYSQAHYHSTTHELLIVIRGSATVQLGGTDQRARPRKDAIDDSCSTLIELSKGDVLLVPAGYSHRSRESQGAFTMIGSYPQNAQKWDMRFPNINGCPHDCEKIATMTRSTKRKGLLDAASPEKIFSDDTSSESDDLIQQWKID